MKRIEPCPSHTDVEGRPQSPRSSRAELRSTKMGQAHVERSAIVYVRQSSLQQVVEHRESRERQYELVEKAAAWGWPSDRVSVIDEDQGHSGRFAANRAGFQQLLTEVSLNHLGLVLGLEMSRLARSSKDWQHLLEICALCGTLLADQEGIYDPVQANDRLLLGLKGTMSEFELITMRNRLERGRWHKAERAELFHGAPIGYVRLREGGVEQDPDERVRSVVELIFAKFEELGSLGKLLRYLLEHNIRIGKRRGAGWASDPLEWNAPHCSTLRQMLHRPIYAGAYAYGRSERVVDAPAPERPHSRSLPPEKWKVLKRDCLPAYITWEQYQQHRQRLRQNRSRSDTAGAARGGSALLPGLLVCGHCGHAMTVEYPRRGRPTYCCRWHGKNSAGPNCGNVQAAALDAMVTEQVLQALAPAAVALHLQAVEEIEQERARLHEHWRLQLEQARYEAQRAERQYQAVEPEHRAAARTLEARWEEALQQERRRVATRFEKTARNFLGFVQYASIFVLLN